MMEFPHPPAAWPLLGRKHVLDVALRVLESDGQGLVIAGERGVGRTRLAQAISDTAEQRGLSPVCLASTEVVEGDVRALLSRSVAAERKVVLVVDDAHRLDVASARAVARRIRAGGVFAVLTVVDGEPTPDPIRALWRDGLLRVVELQPLGETEIATLVAAALGADVDRGTQRLLWRASGGNLIWLRELLQEGLRRGALERRAGVWRWSGPLALGMALRDAVAEPLAALPDAARRVLETIALTEPLELSLAAASSRDAALELLERRGLVVVERDGRRRHARLRHSLLGEAVRAGVPESLAARHLAEIGKALVGLGLRRDGDRLRAARLLLDGEPAAGLPHYANAAEEAWATNDPALAERLARAALDGPERDLARHVLAEALADQGRFEDAVAEWEALEACELDEGLRVRAATSHAAILHFARARSADARDALERAASRVSSGDTLRFLTAMGALIDVSRLPPARLLTEVEPLLAQTDLPPHVATRAFTSLFTAANAQGRFDRVLDDRARALRAARSCQRTYALGELWIHVNTFYALLLIGALDAAEALASEQREARADDAVSTTRAYWTQGLGIVAVWRGRVTTAAAHFREAASLLLEYDNGTRQLVLCDLAVALAMAGAVREAEDALREAEASRPGLGVLLTGPARARAYVQAARGERSAARAASRDAAEGFLASGRVLHGILALHDAVCFGDGRASAERLRLSAEETDGPMLRALAAHGVARATRDAAGLDDASGRLAALGLCFYAADAARAACEEHARAGRTAASLASRVLFERLAARCEGAAFPPLLPPGDPLTRREREVAELAAQGASDHAIATRLSLSVRTVHAHLRSVYDKLGVVGRRELGVLLAPVRCDRSPHDGSAT
jgi:DNA-binding NarL/FixJ family response regulator